MTPDSDMTLVELARAGNAGAVESLFERHYTGVYRLAYKWCGTREDAEDIAQEVFVKLIRKLHTFSGRSSFRTWLFRIVVNTANDFDRKRIRKQNNEAAFAREQDFRHPDRFHVNPPDTGRLLAAIATLPAKQKAAVLLVFGEGMPHKAAARVLGCAETTVSWRIFQARKKLTKLLGRDGVK